jgi:uncharacterized Zn-binding protein involved in type VI secretion
MNARHAAPGLLSLALLATVSFTACTKQESIREIDWAKAALARNPAYEIVATDESTGVFTVRDTTTGTVSTLKLGDLIAAPRPAPAAKPVESAAPATDPVQMPELPADTHALAENQTTETVEAVPAGNGASLAEGPGYSITRATGSKPEAAPTEALEGPGYKIERAGIESEATASKAPGKPAASDEEAVASVIEKRSDPIICQGDRLMRIDGETIEFSGDAVIAEKGCDLYISNARISAGGVGIIVRQARVHIVNSSIGGSRGSYEVSDGAEIYVARTTFTGVGRRFEGGTMNDLGGNSYESH